MDSLVILCISLFGASIMLSGKPRRKTYREKSGYNQDVYYRKDNLSKSMSKVLAIVIFFYALGIILTK